MRMPDKNIDIWALILRWIQNALPFIGGFSLAAVVSYIRERRSGSSWKQSIGESITCGLLSIGAIRLIEWILSRSGADESWNLLAEFCGVIIGFLGTEKLYAVIEGIFLIIKKKFGVNE